MRADRGEFQFLQDVGGGTEFAFVEHLPLSDEGEGEVGELHEVAAGTNAAVLRDVRRDAVVDEVAEQFHRVDMNTGLPVGEGEVA